MKKVGILTFHWADDFGGMLQAYALKQFITANGLGEAEIIPYETAALRGRYWLIPYRPKYSNHPLTGAVIKREARFALRNFPWKMKRICKMARFRKKHLTRAKKIRSEKKLNQLPYDLIVLGSDQIWNPDITYRLEKAYFGAFPKNDETMTLAYAASLGKPQLDDQYNDEFKQLIRSVDVISVREASSVPYVQRQSGKTVCCMPDPTLLLSREQWAEIAHAPDEAEYVLLHYTEYNEELVNQAVRYAKERNLPLISLKSIHIPGEEVQVRFDIGPDEFLGYIQNAACVFTNSFHATVFSLLFEKAFVCYAHKTLGNRTNDLLMRFGIECENGKILSIRSGDDANQTLENMRQDAYTFFKENLSYQKADISQNCKGCGVCAAVCPRDAIILKPSRDGFSYPYINKERCVSCDICSAACPDHHAAEKRADEAIYGCKCKDEEIRKRSTSGGMFYLFAEQIISLGGCVYGAVLDKAHVVRHVCAEQMEDVLPMQGAKYVESQLGDCYMRIKQQLLQRPVLFTGTPCQVAGLRAFVGNPPNLYTVDMVCHGAASPKVFSKYINWLSQKGTVTDFCFRSKVTGWHTSSVTYRQNGDTHVERMGQNLYTKLYFRGLISRESCHTCQYASFDRFSDVTIADYWGIEKIKPEFDDNQGVSLVVLHTEKGKALFEAVSSRVDYFLTSREQCLQPQLKAPADKNPNRNELTGDLDTMDFGKLFRKYYLRSNKEQLKKRIAKMLRL